MDELLNTTPEEALAAFVVLALAGLFALRSKNAKRAAIAIHLDPLDKPLFQWAPDEPYTVRHLLANTLILGGTGSGKTSGSGKCLMRAIVNYPNSGGLICAAKPTDADAVRAIFQAAGRREDLLVVNPDGELRFNGLDHERSMGADAREITRWITTVAETLRAGESKGGGEMGDFWDRENERLIYNSVVVLLLATGKITIPDIQRFITTALENPQQISSPEWAGCFHDKCMRAAFDAPKNRIQQHDFDLTADYFFREWCHMADRTKSSIKTGVLGILHCMNSGLGRVLCSETSNVSPDDMLRGRWILVNMPPSTYGATGSFVNAVWKYATQKMVLRRKAEPSDAPVVIWCDEFQQFCNSHDSHFLAQCRSHGGALVALTQSCHSIYGSMRGETGRHQASALLSNFQHKIFHALGDSETAEYASKLLGREERTKIGGSTQPDEDIWSAMFGPPKITTSFHDAFEPVLEPAVFQTGLRTGGAQNGYLVDAIVIKSGEPFPKGGNWRLVTFDQRG